MEATEVQIQTGDYFILNDVNQNYQDDLQKDMYLETVQSQNKLFVRGCGVLRADGILKSRFTQIYTPVKGNFIIGRLADKSRDGWLVDLKTPRYAFLSKKFIGKQTLQQNNYVYCYVMKTGIGIQTELKYEDVSCYQLFPEEGMLVHLPPSRCVFLTQDRTLQIEIAKRLKFELYIGLNGLIFVKTESKYDQFTIKHALFMDDVEDVRKWIADRKQLEQKTLIQ